jgi:hypothetical protein
MSKEQDLVCIFSGSPVNAEMIKEILDDNGIAANFKNQYMGTIAPWYVSGGGASPAEVEVFIKDETLARSFVEEFHKSA